jgi:hypothetical protein
MAKAPKNIAEMGGLVLFTPAFFRRQMAVDV